MEGIEGFAQIYWFGKTSNQNILVMELLGPTLEDLLNNSNRKFSLKTVLLLAIQLVYEAQCVSHRNLDHSNWVCPLKGLHSQRCEARKLSYWEGEKRRHNIFNWFRALQDISWSDYEKSYTSQGKEKPHRYCQVCQHEYPYGLW